jgi:hypothetical protein
VYVLRRGKQERERPTFVVRCGQYEFLPRPQDSREMLSVVVHRWRSCFGWKTTPAVFCDSCKQNFGGESIIPNGDKKEKFDR